MTQERVLRINPCSPTDKVLLKSQFALFSKFGDKASDGETIKLSQSDKWFKQVKQIKDFMITMGGRNGKVQK